MSNFQRMLEDLDALNLPSNQYAITSSGPLAIRNIREAGDIDIIVSDNLWKELSKRYSVHHLSYNDSIEIGNIQILGNWENDLERKYSTTEQIETADVFGGRRYVNLKIILHYKKLGTREKDARDVSLINEYLKNQAN